MDLSKQGKQNNDKAERLARRNERGRQRRLEETAEERETRLAKRREAWKNRTAEAKVSKKSVGGSTGNRKKLQKAPRKKKLGWQSAGKQGEKQKVSKTSIMQEIKWNLRLNIVKLRDFK